MAAAGQSPTNFRALFRRATGVAPNTYRATFRGKLNN
jgi:transcriptional regulator GlxA family with amidase domain